MVELPLLLAVSEVTAWVTLAMVIIGTGLKLWSQLTENAATKAKLEKAQSVVGAIGDAINDVTPLLGPDKAKLLKGKVGEHARVANVHEELEELVERFHLNARPTAELANPLDA